MRDLGRARELAERFQADLDRPLGELSRGNRQKVGLVQAAFHDPELLVLDEPSSGLDPLMQEEFLAFVAEERERGHTVFLSSHELDEVQRACDRVAIIREGRLVAVESVEDVTGRSYRHVTIEFAGPVEIEEFRRIPGVNDLVHTGSRLTFKLAGDVDPVIKAAARHTVTELELEPPHARGGLPHLLRRERRPMSRDAAAQPRRRRARRPRLVTVALRCAPSCAAACATTGARG